MSSPALETLQPLLRPSVVAPVLAVAYLLYKLLGRPAGLPDVPILGAKESDWFPFFQASLRNTKDFKSALKDAYKNYRNQAVLMPLMGAGNQRVLLPVSDTQFVVDQPDEILNNKEAIYDTLQTPYMVTDFSIVSQPIHHKVVLTTLTSQTGSLVPAVAEEITIGFDEMWGAPQDWKEITVYPSVRKIIGRASNRVFMGAPLCRSEELLEASMAFAKDLAIGSTMLKFFPPFLRPLVAPIILMPNRRHTREFTATIQPEIEKRLREYDAKMANGKDSFEPENNDFLQWLIHMAKETGQPNHWKTSVIAGRMLMLEVASIHSSSFILTGAILDMAHAGPEAIAELREEITMHLNANEGVWDKKTLAKMDKLDSVMRESARLNSFNVVALVRKVMKEGGVTTPSGTHLQKGSILCVPGYTPMHDDANYPNAEEFQPFRFAKQRSVEGQDYMTGAKLAFATTNTEYFAFGHGRHACPGRFFAASELKMMLAHTVLHYDIEAVAATRPANRWIGISRSPPTDAKIRIRKRECSF